MDLFLTDSRTRKAGFFRLFKNGSTKQRSLGSQFPRTDRDVTCDHGRFRASPRAFGLREQGREFVAPFCKLTADGKFAVASPAGRPSFGRSQATEMIVNLPTRKTAARPSPVDTDAQPGRRGAFSRVGSGASRSAFRHLQPLPNRERRGGLASGAVCRVAVPKSIYRGAPGGIPSG